MAAGVSDGVSIVTTTYMERDNIPRLVERIRSAVGVKHEIIVVDDSSPDGTYEAAKRLADVAVKKPREGQTSGLLYGIKIARYPIVVTIDADLENPPELIPVLLKVFEDGRYDLLVACRSKLPRISEVVASKTLGSLLGVSDVFSNFRVYRKDLFMDVKLRLGETFGAELLAIAKRRGYRIGEFKYDPPRRRSRPRIGGRLVANTKIAIAVLKVLLYLFAP